MTQSLTIFWSTLLLILLASADVYAQGGCQPGQAGAPLCEFACLSCNLDGTADQTGPALPTTPLTIDQCNFGVPPITLENPRWYAFVAGTTFIEFLLKPIDCSSGSGLEYAVLTSCDKPYRSVVCGTIDPALPTFIAPGLIIGNVYYLVIDGVNAAMCKYLITVNQGSTVGPELGTLGDITGPTQVCPKALVNYTIPPVPYALSYTWTAPAGSKINGGGSAVVVPANGDKGTTVSVLFGNLGGNICVTASNVCDTPKTICLPVVNQAIPITQLPDRELCFEELPFFWEEEPGNFISAPGTYTFTSTPYTSFLGCDSTVRQKIIAKPRKFKNLPPTWLCQGDCLRVGDYDYCESGNFQEMLVAEDGCDSMVNFTIIVIPVRSGVVKPDTITCRTPSIVLRKDSTTTVANTVVYKWVNNLGTVISNADTAVVTDAGPYYFIVTNNGGGKACPDTTEVLIPVNKTAPVSNAGPNRIITCEEPQIQLQGSGSTGPQYTYLWIALNGGNIVSGSATLTPTINTTGTYRLRVTNQINGCTATDNTIVSAETAPPIVNAGGGTYNCLTPSVALTSTTNAVNPTYAWTGPNGFTSALQNPVANVSGNYTVVVTDGNTGCTNSAVAEVIANTAVPGASTSSGVLTCVVDAVILGGASPAPNPQFAWTGPNGFASSLSNPTVTEAGTYVLVVTGANGCTSSATALVPLDDTPPGATLAVPNNLNCNNATVNITASSTAPPTSLQHNWTRPDGSTTATGVIPVLAAGAPGNYSVVITNTENGCTSSASAAVNQTPAVTAAVGAVSNALCFGQQNGSASVTPGGGNGAYTYLWNTGNNTQTLNNVGSGTYTVTITDGENCTATATATITQPALLTVNAASTPQMANGVADGTATVSPAGGTAAYTYLWSNGETTQSVADLLPGSFTVTVTDANGCTAVTIATVNAYDCTIDAAVDATDATCFEANNGQATVVTINGQTPFTYAWSTGETTVSIGNLKPGVYTVVVTDAANCPEAIAFTISEPNLLKANATSANSSGPLSNDGSAEANPTGGVGPYTYLWSTGGTDAMITGLMEGSYTVTVTDENGCTAVQTVQVIAGNCGIVANFITAPVVCNGQNDGAATIVLNGGTGPFTYLWSTGGTAETEPNLPAGTHTVTVTDANNCEITEEVTITEPPALTLALDNVVSTPCPNVPEGSATVVAAGGTSPISISWSNGQSGPTAVDLIAGTYTVTLTDDNECSTTLQVIVQAIDTVPPVIATDNLIAQLGTAGNVTLSIQSVGLDVTDNCGVKTVTFIPGSYNCSQLGPHPVQITATDEAGNTSVDTIIITVVDNLAPTLTCPSSIIRCFGNDIVEYDAPVATDNCLGNGGMFALVTGFPSGTTFPAGTTTNTYTYTDADGNIGSCTFEVTILDPIDITGQVINDIDSQMIARIDINVTGSLSPYTFEWMFNGETVDTTEDLTDIGAGVYTVTVTDEAGCTSTKSFEVFSMVDTDEPAWANGLLIVPNPTSGRLSVIFPDQLSHDVYLTVFDLTGRLVQRESMQAPKRVDFDLSAQPDGFYTLLLQVNGRIVARKIVVSR